MTTQNGGFRPGQWEKRNAAASSGGELAAGQPASLDSLRVEGLPAEAFGGGAAEPAVRAAFEQFGAIRELRLTGAAAAGPLSPLGAEPMTARAAAAAAAGWPAGGAAAGTAVESKELVDWTQRLKEQRRRTSMCGPGPPGSDGGDAANGAAAKGGGGDGGGSNAASAAGSRRSSLSSNCPGRPRAFKRPQRFS